VVRAIAPLLRYPISKVSIVKKYVLMFDSADVRTTTKTLLDGHGAGNSGAHGNTAAPMAPRFISRSDMAAAYLSRLTSRFAQRGRRRSVGAIPRAKIIDPASPKTSKAAPHPPPAPLLSVFLSHLTATL
jgi:hypothetical protein